MTTYSLTGITVLFSDEEDAVANGVETGTELHYYLPDGVSNTLSYTTGTGIDGESDIANIDDPSEALVSLNGGAYPDLSEEFILEVTWNDNGTTRTTIVLGVDELYDTGNGEDYANRMSIFVLSGDALPSITTAAEWLAFEDSITGTGYPSGTYAPNQDILLSSFFPSSSEDDVAYGTSGDDLIETGDGDDDIAGNGGNDTINGGAGEDWVVINAHNATLDGGADFDDAVIVDTSNTAILVDYSAGTTGNQLHISGMTDLEDDSTTQYTVETANVERAVIEATGEVLIAGNDAANRVRFNEMPEVFTFNGGGGTDRLDVDRTWVENNDGDRIRGVTLDFFLENTRLEGSATSLTIYDADDNSVIGVLNDVEDIRFATDEGGREVLTVAEVLALAGGGGGGTTTSGGNDTITGTIGDDTLEGGGGDDTLNGGEGADTLDGGAGSDTLNGGAGDDSLAGGDGADTLIGGDGDDTLSGGDSESDVRDVIYGGVGNDNIDGGYGNDELRGDAGNDSIEGGFGSDTVIGGDGDDVLTGSALSDQVFGGAGSDFVNGGFGHDRVNGGGDADKFFHLGVANHGSDWIQDYDAAEGDVLVFGNSSATIDQFQINFAETENAGEAGVEEAFVIYRPTGQIMWALVDGAAQDEIILRINGTDYDLMA